MSVTIFPLAIPEHENFTNQKICFFLLKILALYNFTTLGATGSDGPDSNAGYSGTGLQNIQIKDGKQEWSVPFTGRFRVEACGASGGKGFNGAEGGRGAKVSGNVTLTKGERLIVLVGQRGSSQYDSHPGSGGGGTFLISQVGPLLVAGGGGGGALKDGLLGNDKQNGSGIGAGSHGLGGFVCKHSDPSGYPRKPNSGSGAGINGSGGCFDEGSCTRKNCTRGGQSFTEGGEGGEAPNCNGGFGGGGACTDYNPGGGGGYSGGGVDDNTAGGGGGSFVDGGTWNIIKGGCDEGDGYVSFISED